MMGYCKARLSNSLIELRGSNTGPDMPQDVVTHSIQQVNVPIILRDCNIKSYKLNSTERTEHKTQTQTQTHTDTDTDTHTHTHTHTHVQHSHVQSHSALNVIVH